MLEFSLVSVKYLQQHKCDDNMSVQSACATHNALRQEAGGHISEHNTSTCPCSAIATLAASMHALLYMWHAVPVSLNTLT